MPVALSERGAFSYDKFTLTSGQATDSPSNRTFTLTKAVFDPTLPETLEVLITKAAGGGAIKLKGDGTATAAGSGDEFYVNSATAPTTMTIETNTVLNAQTDSSVTALGANDLLVIRRISNRTTKNIDYAPGSVIREVDLDSSNTQIIHIAQEAVDIALQSMVLDADDEWEANTKEIKNVAAGTDALDGVNYTQLTATEVDTLAYKEDTEDYKLEARDWAQKNDGQVQVYTDDSPTGSGLGHSAKAHASVVGTHAPSTGSAQEWASEVGANAPSAGSAKEWAQTTGVAIDSTYSAKEYAQGTYASTGGSAKDYATYVG